MTAAELIAAAKLPVDPAKRAQREQALREVVTEAQARYEKQADRRAMTSEDLARTYSL